MMKTLYAGLLTLAALSISSAPATGLAQGWGAQQRVTVTATDSETGLDRRPLAIDSDFGVHLVWAEQDAPSSNYQIYEAVRGGSAWGAPQPAVVYRAEFPGASVGAKYPSLVIDAEDSLHMTWHDYRIEGILNVEIYTKSRAAAAAWDTSAAGDIRLTSSAHSETNGDNSYAPSLAQSASGALHVVWFDYRFDGSNAEIMHKSRSAGAGGDEWDTAPGDSADERLTDNAGDSVYPAIAIDSTGAVHVVWADQANGGVVSYRRRDPGTGDWGGVETVNTGADAVGFPDVAAEPAGVVHVAWGDSREGSQAIFARTRSAAGTWGAEERISPSGVNAQEVALGVAADGTLYAVWQDTRVSILNREVQLQARAVGGSWDGSGASDVRISEGSGHSTRPGLLVDAIGRVHVVWKDRRDGNHEIYYRRWTDPAATAVALAPSPASGAGLIAGVAPNPGADRFRVTIAAGVELLDLAIFDASGRRVRTLASGAPGAAEQSVPWDGRDVSGRRVPAGLYFVRAASPASAHAARLVVLR